MSDLSPSSARIDELFQTSLRAERAAIDRMFLLLLGAQWAAAIAIALVLTPIAWDGGVRALHPHVWTAVLLGGLVNAAPAVLIVSRSGAATTRHVVAVTQMLWSAVLIHITGGRIETHFHVFGSLAFIAFYRDWTVLATAAVVVALDHLVRGALWPLSVYGTIQPGVWRLVEHVAWVGFEEVVLIFGCVRGIGELRRAAQREAWLECVKDQVQAEVQRKTRALKASIDQARALVKVTNVVPWELDAQTLAFTYISSQAIRVFGSSLRQAVGEPFNWDAVIPGDRERVRQQFEALSRGSSGDHLEVDFGAETDDRRFLQVRCLISVYEEPGQPKRLQGVARDITGQRKLELELRQAQKLESVGRLAAGVAHEINTPVQFVSDSVHFIRDVVGDLTALVGRYQDAVRQIAAGAHVGETQAALTKAESDADLDYALEHLPKALDRSLEGLDRVATIVRSMKEFAHPDQKEMAAIDLNQAVESTLVISRHEYKYLADVTTSFGDLPLVLCHPGDINQVVLNIIVNAAHAIGGVVNDSGARGRIDVRTWRDGHDVVLSIGDTGGGIPHAIRDRIFDPFFTTKDVGQGSGQGLALARSVIVERHGGQLTFESEVGGGTTFFIRLPFDGAARAAA